MYFWYLKSKMFVFKSNQTVLELSGCLKRVLCTQEKHSSYGELTLEYKLSHIMRKYAFCICINKVTYQLHDNSAADQYHFFSTWYNIKNIFYGCSAGFVLDLVGNPKDRFRDEA